MLKLAGFIIIAILILGFLNPKIFQDWKQKTIEFINPVAKEKRLLGDLSSQINELDSLINNEALSNKEKTKKINSLIQNSHGTISEIGSLNDKSDLISTVGNLLQKVLSTKEKLSPQPTWIPPSLIKTKCDPVKK